MSQTQKNLFRWCVWFFIVNCIVFWLVGLNYLPTIPWIHSGYLTFKWKHELDFFVLISYFGHLGLLGILTGIFVLPCIFFIRSRFVFIFSITLAAISVVLLLIDVITYKLYRFHFNGVVFHLFVSSFNKAFFDFSGYELVLIFLGIITTLLIETLFAWCVWHFIIDKKRMMGMGKWVAVILGASLYLSYSMIIFSFGEQVQRVFIETARFLPLYTEMLSVFLPGENLTATIARVGESHFEHSIRNDSQLNYPMQKLIFTNEFQETKKLNLVIVLIDAWRFDMFNSKVTPFIYEFAKHSWYFSKHFSGGNATGPGVFSLFYGIPAAYWPAMETHERGPILIDALLKKHYKMGIFYSGSFQLPAFNKTVFASLQGSLQDVTGNPYERDQLLTHRFKKFVAQNVKARENFFSYIHFGSAHGYCAFENEVKLFQPIAKTCNRAELGNQTDPAPYFNRYKNALYQVDQQVHTLLATLKKHHLLDNTVVIITGDHGEEFNDNHQGYWSHASNFTSWQVRTPLIVYWPGEKPRIFSHMTSHYDVAPTLMKRFFGSRTPLAAYSIGNDLLDKKAKHPYLWVGGYVDWGILEENRITRVFSTGEFQIEKSNSEPESSAQLHIPVLANAFADMRRFYK